MTPVNTLPFLCSTLTHFAQAHIKLWVFGGWAEELWQLIPPRTHNDVDLLYPAPCFAVLDQFLAQEEACVAIPRKRFSHKRAVVYHGIMIEFFLVQETAPRLFTSFFDDHFRLQWPADLLNYEIVVVNQDIAVASQAALIYYRQQHQFIEQAYSSFLRKQDERTKI